MIDNNSNITIECGDCLDLMAGIPAGSVKAVIADPPYYQGLTHNGQRGSFTDLNICKPFFQKFFREIKRVLEPENGFFYCFTDWRGIAFYMPIMEAEIGVRNLLVWDKISGCGSFYAFAYEMILFWCNNSKGVPAGGGQNVIRGYPGFSGGAKKTNGEKIHPTQKTLELISKLVQDSTEPGDLVLDPFMGSGTTGVACRNLGRDFIGYELQEKYYEVAKNRIFANCENPE